METDRPLDVLRHYERYRNEEIIKYMPYRPGLQVLVCRPGKGMLLRQLRGRTAAAWGVDLCSRTLRQRSKPAQAVRARHTCLPFQGRSFDVVVGDRVLEHALAPAPLLDELARVLRPGGRLILWERRAPGGAQARLLPDLMRAGLVLLCEEPFDYLAYPIAVSGNQIPRLRSGQPAHAVIKLMFAVDGLLARVPALQDKSWHRILVAEKRGIADEGSTDR